MPRPMTLHWWKGSGSLAACWAVPAGNLAGESAWKSSAHILLLITSQLIVIKMRSEEGPIMINFLVVVLFLLCSSWVIMPVVERDFFFKKRGNENSLF